MEKEEKIKIGISIGDLNGIGGELVIKTFEDNRMLEFCTPIVYTSVKSVVFLKKHFQSSLEFNKIKAVSQTLKRSAAWWSVMIIVKLYSDCNFIIIV